MNILEYAKKINEYNQRHKTTLAHGMEWKKHKYIRKEGNRYIYPEDLKKRSNTGANPDDIAKNAAASRYGGDASRYANSTGAQLKIQKQQEENYNKNAAAAQYNKDYNAIKEEMKSYDAKPSQKTFDKISSMMVKNPMAGSQVMDLERYDKPTQQEATNHVNNAIAREASYMGWKTNSESAKKNAAAAKFGGDAARYANSNGAKLKIQKQLEETIAKNAAAAKFGGDAARYANKPQSNKQPTNAVTNDHHGQTVKPDENKHPVNVEKTPKVTEEKKQEAYNYASDAWNKIDQTQLSNFIYLAAFNQLYGGYGGSEAEYNQASNYIDEFTNKVFEDAAAKYGDAFDADGLYDEIKENLQQAILDTYTVLVADFNNQQQLQQQLLMDQMMGFRSKSLPSRNTAPNSATNAYKNVDQGKIYKKKKG